MKRRVLCFFAFLSVLAVCFTACNSNDSGSSKNPSQNDTGNKIAVTYYITAGGESKEVYAVGGELKLEKMPERTGYEFLGLYDAPEGGSQILTPAGKCNIEITKPLTLYARWSAKRYTFVFDAQGGSFEKGQNNSMTVLYGETLGELPVPSRDGYRFAGWVNGGEMCSDSGTPKSSKSVFDEDAYTISGGEVTLSAKWEIKKMTVVFDYNNGTYQNESRDFDYGAELNDSAFPKMEDDKIRGLEFVGWSIERNTHVEFKGNVTKDMTLYAVWREYKTVILNKGDGTENEELRIYRSDVIDCPVPERKHYIFDGWYSTKLFSGMPLTTLTYSSGATEIYAKWIPAEYKISFVTDTLAGGSTAKPGEQSPVSVLYGGTLGDLPVPDCAGYDFIGWYGQNGEEYSSVGTLAEGKNVFNEKNYPIEGDGVTLYAKWAKKQMTVVFDYNNGTGKTETVKIEYGTKPDASSFPTMDDGSKMIVGWSLSHDTKVDFEGTVTENITLYAVWCRYKTVTVYRENGEASDKIIVYQDKAEACPAVEREHYVFGGWYSSKQLGGDAITELTYDDGVTEIYAKWTPVEYKISFIVGGTKLEDVIYTIESGAALPTARKENYDFLGWCRNEDLSDAPITALAAGNTGSFTLYAKFRGESRKITLKPMLGTVLDNFVWTEYGKAYKLPVPECKGYVFVGWFDEGGTRYTDENGEALSACGFEQKEIELTAKYSKKYYITFESDPSGAGYIDAKDYYLAGETVTLEIKVNPGYRYKGVVCDNVALKNTLKQTFVMPEEDVSLKGVFEAMKYSVSLNAGGGFCKDSAVTLTFGSGYTLPVVWKTGHIFMGWTTADGKTVTDENGNSLKNWDITKDTELTASFKENPEADKFVLVYDAETFMSMMNNPAGDYTLVADVDLSGVSWTPFAFSGTLSGNGYTVKNLNIYSSEICIGMFTELSGTVKDITFENLTVESTQGTEYAQAGGICAFLSGTLDNVCVGSGSVKAKNADVGGLVGKITGGTVKNCRNYAAVSCNTGIEAGSVGGIAGSCTSATEISGCENHGKITGTYQVGGIIGVIQISGESPIQNVVNYGAVCGTRSVGGVAGRVYSSANASVNWNSSNCGTVSGGTYTGGVIGEVYVSVRNEGTFNISGLDNSGAVTGSEYVGGIVGRLALDSTKKTIVLEAFDLVNTGAVKGSCYVGGIVGYGNTDSASSKISNSNNSGAVTAEYYLGGIAGKLSDITVDSCSNKGTVLTCTGYQFVESTYYTYLGGYVGYGTSVVNCINEASVSSANNGSYVGGIAGYANGVISSCTNSADVTAPKCSYVGGIAGYIYNGNESTSSLLTNTGNITGNNYVGGIVGRYEFYHEDNRTSTLAKYENSGVISGAEYVGGTIGEIYADAKSGDLFTLNISEFKNTGNVTGTHYVGGLIGKGSTDTNASKIMDSSSSGAVTGEYYVGGIAGKLSAICINNCSNEGSTVKATKYLLDGTNYYTYLGGYVGSGSTVIGCSNAADIVCDEKGAYIGGIAGYASGYITSCTNSADVTAPKCSYVGGIAGYIYNGNESTSSLLTNTGNINGNNYVGGIAGRYEFYHEDNRTSTLAKYENSGVISGAEYVGGTIGEIYADAKSSDLFTINISEFKNKGNVTGTHYVGGLIGKGSTDTSASKIMDSSSSGAVTGEYYVGGIAGKLSAICIKNCSNEGSTVKATKYLLDGTNYYTYLGGYVGSGSTVIGCSNAADIVCDEKGAYIGGIAGYASGYITSCTNAGSVFAPNCSYVGGLAGYIYSGDEVTSASLANTGNITGKNYVGGIVGRYEFYHKDNRTANLAQYSNVGNITGVEYVGGIVGEISAEGYSSDVYTVNMVEFSNKGKINGTSYVGGLIGKGTTDTSKSQIAGSFNSGTVAAASYAGGIAGYLGSIQVNDLCENTADITSNEKGSHIGGIAGYVNRYVSDSSNSGAVYAPDCDYVGGIAGYIYSGDEVTSSSLVNTGSVTGNNYVGGIVGRYEFYHKDNRTANLSRYSNSGEVVGAEYVGGIAGDMKAEGYSSDLYTVNMVEFSNEGNVTAANCAGGLVGSFVSDTSASVLTGYTSKGTVTCASELKSDLVAQFTKLVIN